MNEPLDEDERIELEALRLDHEDGHEFEKLLHKAMDRADKAEARVAELEAEKKAIESVVAAAAMELGEYAACWGSRQAIDAIINMVSKCQAAGRGEAVEGGK